MIDTPIAEEGFVGAAIGAAWMGERPVVELQFADFVTCAVRPDRHGRREDALALGSGAAARDPLPDGRRRPRRPVPRRLARGLVRRPARAQGRLPRDRRGRLRAAARRRSTTPTPCSCFEHKGLYRRLRDEAPPAGSPRRRSARRASCARGLGRDGRHLRLRGDHSRWPPSRQLGVDVEVLDLRTVWPLDAAAVLDLGRAKTSRLLVLQEASRSTGVAGLVLSLVARRGVRAARRPAGAPRAARHAGPVRARAGGRVPAVDGVDGARRWRSSLPTEPCLRRRRRRPRTRGSRSSGSCCSSGSFEERALTPLPAGSDRRLVLRRARSGGGRRRGRASHSARTTSSARSTASSRATSRAG